MVKSMIFEMTWYKIFLCSYSYQVSTLADRTLHSWFFFNPQRPVSYSKTSYFYSSDDVLFIVIEHQINKELELSARYFCVRKKAMQSSSWFRDSQKS